MIVAQTIKQQINSLDRMALMAYGAREFMGIREDAKQLGALSFEVSGTNLYRQPAYVKISLNGKDLYDIEVSRVRKFERKVLDNMNDVYAEDLVLALDKLLEGRQ